MIPISYLWDGAAFIINTPPGWYKVWAFERNPHVAFTVGSTDFPPRIMLVRGKITKMEVRPGVPDEDVEASRRIVDSEQMEERQRGVRATIDEMMVITITPTWLNIIDSEHSFPGPRRD